MGYSEVHFGLSCGSCSELRYFYFDLRRAGGRACVFSRAAARACFCLCHRPVSRALAAGFTWTSRTTSAPWAVRSGHTSVVDAAGAIYVIGGESWNSYLQDVWVSTDGGVRPDSVGGWSEVLGGYSGVL